MLVELAQEAGLGLGGIRDTASHVTLIPRNEVIAQGVRTNSTALSELRSYLNSDTRSDFDRWIAVPEAIRTPVRIALVKHAGQTIVNSTLKRAAPARANRRNSLQRNN